MSIGFPDIGSAIWYRISWQEAREYRWDFANLGTGPIEAFRITNTLSAFRNIATSSCDSTNLTSTGVIPDIRYGGTTALDAQSGAAARNDSNTFFDNQNNTTRQESTWSIVATQWIAITSTVV